LPLVASLLALSTVTLSFMVQLCVEWPRAKAKAIVNFSLSLSLLVFTILRTTSFEFDDIQTSRSLSLRGTGTFADRSLQTFGTIGGSSSFTANTNSGAGSSTGEGSTATIDGNLVGMSKGSATILGPESGATGNTKAGGTGTGLNQVFATDDAVEGASTVKGSTVIDTKGNFAGLLSPAVTGGLGGGLGTLTVTSAGTGTGPASVSSANSGTIFGSGEAQAANQFGRAGGGGSGVGAGASFASGVSEVDPDAVLSGAGEATANFGNSGAGAFASPAAFTAGATPATIGSSSFVPNNAQPNFFTGGSVSSNTNAPPAFSTGGQGFATTGLSGGTNGFAFP
jgi:hypothetical protein